MKRWTTPSGCQVIQVLGGRSNAYLVVQRDRAILVDTGWKYAWPALAKRLVRLLPAPTALAALVLTPAHFDHTENAAAIYARYSVPVIVQREEAGWPPPGIIPCRAGPISPPAG
jgi:hydroxyacylglutathione hydrolase